MLSFHQSSLTSFSFLVDVCNTWFFDWKTSSDHRAAVQLKTLSTFLRIPSWTYWIFVSHIFIYLFTVMVSQLLATCAAQKYTDVYYFFLVA